MGNDADKNLKVGIQLDGSKTGVDADVELAKVRAQIQGATNDAERYQAALARMNQQNPGGSNEDQAKNARIEEQIMSQRMLGTTVEENASESSRANLREIEETERVTFGKHELHGAVRLLGEEFRGLGGLAHFLFSPTGILLGGILLATRAIGFFREGTKQLTDAIREMGDALHNIGQIENPVAKVDVDAITKAAEATQKLADAEDNARTFADDLKTSMSRELSDLNALADADSKEIKAREALAIAKSREEGAASGRSPELQKIEEAKIRLRYSGMENTSSQYYEAQRTKLLVDEQTKRQNDQPSLEEWATSAVRAQAALGAGQSVAELQSHAKAEQGEIDNLTGQRDAQKAGSDKWKDLDNQIQSRQKGLDAILKAIPDRAEAEKHATDEINKSSAALSENTKRLQELGNFIPQKISADSYKNQSAGIVAKYNAEAAAAEAHTDLMTEHGKLDEKVKSLGEKRNPTADDYKEITATFRELIRILPILSGETNNAGDRSAMRIELDNVKKMLADILSRQSHPTQGQ